MGYYRKWKPSKTAARQFAEKMNDVDEFCYRKGIRQSASSDSYYFTIDGINYRVSNHSIAASDNGMYGVDPVNGGTVQLRESYHDKDDGQLVCIHAGKTRIIEIYTNLEKGCILDGHGNIKR